MRLPRWLKLMLIGFAVFVVVAVIALVVIVKTLDLDRYARLAIAEVKTLTGRELTVRGKLEVRGFPRLKVIAEDVSFANAAWGSRPEMLKAKRVEGTIALLPLLQRKVQSPASPPPTSSSSSRPTPEEPATGRSTRPRTALPLRQPASTPTSISTSPISRSTAARSRGGTARHARRSGSRCSGCGCPRATSLSTQLSGSSRSR
jgi:hypothetical protein